MDKRKSCERFQRTSGRDTLVSENARGSHHLPQWPWWIERSQRIALMLETVSRVWLVCKPWQCATCIHLFTTIKGRAAPWFETTPESLGSWRRRNQREKERERERERNRRHSSDTERRQLWANSMASELTRGDVDSSLCGVQHSEKKATLTD